MKDRWGAHDLSALVDSRFGSEQASRTLLAALGMTREATFAAYHAQRFRELQGSIDISGHRDPGRAVMGLVALAATGLDGGDSFSEASFGACAHFMAFVRSLHAAYDLSAMVVYQALNVGALPGSSLGEDDANPARVLKALERSRAYPRLFEPMRDLAARKSIIYIKDLSNASKHRMLVDLQYNVHLRFDGSESPHGVRVARFQVRGREHEARWGGQVVRDVHRDVVLGLIQMLCRLNDEVRVR